MYMEFAVLCRRGIPFKGVFCSDWKPAGKDHRQLE